MRSTYVALISLLERQFADHWPVYDLRLVRQRANNCAENLQEANCSHTLVTYIIYTIFKNVEKINNSQIVDDFITTRYPNEHAK